MEKLFDPLLRGVIQIGKALVICVAVIFLLIGVFILIMRYNMNYKVTTVGTEQSEDGQYEIVFQMIGQPEFPFGATSVRFIVQDFGGRVIDKRETLIFDDGAFFRPENWQVNWEEQFVVIILRGEEQEDSAYRISLE